MYNKVAILTKSISVTLIHAQQQIAFCRIDNRCRCLMNVVI